MKIGILNNLRAGRSHRQVGKILTLLRDFPHVRHEETTGIRAVPEALTSLARQNVDLLVVNGGDGTLQHALTRILSTDEFSQIPFVAPLRGGRTNMSAADLGAHRSPVQGLRGLLEDVESGRLAERVVDRPVLRVESLRERQVRYGFFFGAGMIHRAITLTHDVFPQGKIQGAFGAGLVTASLIARASAKRLAGVLSPDKAQIVLDGELVPRGEFTLMIASSLQRLFLRMNPFWGEEKGPVRFTAVATGTPRIAAAAPGILRGRPKPFVKSEEGFTSRNVSTAQLRLDSGYTVDGEFIKPRTDEIVRITGDHRVRFVRA